LDIKDDWNDIGAFRLQPISILFFPYGSEDLPSSFKHSQYAGVPNAA
jgi:hypothetical protein